MAAVDLEHAGTMAMGETVFACRQAEVAWHLSQGPLPYWRGRVTSLRYEFAD